MKKALLTIVGILTVSGMCMAGCGKKENYTTKESVSVAVETVESEEESRITPPYEKAMEEYDSVISNLSKGQHYAFADAGVTGDVLLVADEVYDNQDGRMCAINATVYGLDKDGNVMKYTEVQSAGTAYPLAATDGCLFFGNGHEMSRIYVDESLGSVMTKENASEVYSEDGSVKYYYFSLDDEFEGEVEDDSKLMNLFEEYSNATPINFVEVE